jgi:hypothetical protein
MNRNAVPQHSPGLRNALPWDTSASHQTTPTGLRNGPYNHKVNIQRLVPLALTPIDQRSYSLESSAPL